jgi:hypothetical protein
MASINESSMTTLVALHKKRLQLQQELKQTNVEYKALSVSVLAMLTTTERRACGDHHLSVATSKPTTLPLTNDLVMGVYIQHLKSKGDEGSDTDRESFLAHLKTARQECKASKKATTYVQVS